MEYFGKATKAKEETEKSKAEEQVKIAVMASYDSKNKLDINRVKEELKKIPEVGRIQDTAGEFPIEVDLDGYTFEIDENGNVKRKSGKPTVSHKLSVTDQVEEGTEVIVTISAITTEGTIVKITKPDGTFVDNTDTTTFLVNKNGVYTVVVEGSNREKTSYEVKITNIGNTEIFSNIYTETKTYIDSDGKTARIPEGFAVGESNTINKIENGLVITDEIDEFCRSTGNEFVWIPVANAEDFKRVDWFSQGNLQDYVSSGNFEEPCSRGSEEEKQLYDAMYASVTNEKNRGFYIGRYEAGQENGKVVVKKGGNSYANLPWSNSKDMTKLSGGVVQLSKEFVNDKPYLGKVVSTLVYGTQMDVAFTFQGPSKYYTNNELSTLQGGYYKTGSNELACVKNIYDLVSGADEWTWEAGVYIDSRVYRQHSDSPRMGDTFT